MADFHRTLLKGGIFLYPPTAQHPDGKLRLMYEANPIAFLAEQAGGMATDGAGRILEHAADRACISGRRCWSAAGRRWRC